MSVCWSVHHFGPDQNISTTTKLDWLQFCTDIPGPQRMNPSYFGFLFFFIEISTIIGWIVIKLATCIYCPQIINADDFSDPHQKVDIYAFDLNMYRMNWIQRSFWKYYAESFDRHHFSGERRVELLSFGFFHIWLLFSKCVCSCVRTVWQDTYTAVCSVDNTCNHFGAAQLLWCNGFKNVHMTSTQRGKPEITPM